MTMTMTSERPFSWSYSRLNSYEICPRRFYETQILKKWPEPRSEALSYGDDVHEAMAVALRYGTALPITYASYQPWIDKVNRTEGELLVECKWAITREFQPTAWFANQVWCRTIADAVKISDDVGLVVDWKTGRSANADPLQLTLTSLIALCLFPKLQCVRSDFVWLQEDSQTTQSVYRHEAASQWAEIMPRVETLQKALANEHFPPKPNSFCNRFCPVKTCEYHGTKQ